MVTFGDMRTVPAIRHATHVVVDTKDGYTFWKGGDGELFRYEGAREFAEHRNAEMKPEHRSYLVFALRATAETVQAMRHAAEPPVIKAEYAACTGAVACDECGELIPGELISAEHAASCSCHPANVA
jgi:hypothetical protein